MGAAHSGGAILTLEWGDQRFEVHIGKAYLEKHDPAAGGYFVEYDDGYESFSPAKAFNEGYTLVEDSGTDFLHALLHPTVQEVIDDEVRKRMGEALSIAANYGAIDGAHHKAWVIDQMVRKIAGSDYPKVVAAARNGEDGPETYAWDEGIAP